MSKKIDPDKTHGQKVIDLFFKLLFVGNPIFEKINVVLLSLNKKDFWKNTAENNS